MVDDGHFAVGLFYLELGSGGLHPQGVIVCGVDNHDGLGETCQSPTLTAGDELQDVEKSRVRGRYWRKKRVLVIGHMSSAIRDPTTPRPTCPWLSPGPSLPSARLTQRNYLFPDEITCH